MDTDETVTHATIVVIEKYSVRKLTFPILFFEDVEVLFTPLKHLVDYWNK